jgi:hypothetical protein
MQWLFLFYGDEKYFLITVQSLCFHLLLGYNLYIY